MSAHVFVVTMRVAIAVPDEVLYPPKYIDDILASDIPCAGTNNYPIMSYQLDGINDLNHEVRPADFSWERSA